jgi:drug/metabolite transporter (DMT)-like permease
VPVGAQLYAPDPSLAVALSPNLRGSLFMAIAMASFTMNDAITKAVSSKINFGEIMLVRGVFAIVLIAALTISRGAIRPVRTLMVKPVALRVMGEVGGTVAFLAAIVHLPLANISAIMQVLPLAITLGAAVVLSEPVGWRRWTAIGIGFAGVLVIVRPGLDGFNQFALLALISVLFCTLRDLATNRIPAEIPSLFITLLTTIVVTVVGALVLVPLGGWVQPSARVVGLLALAAVFVLTGYQCVIMAMRAGDISAVAPFRYTALLWAILLGYILFSEVPDGPMIVGASMIVASGLYAFYRERVRARMRPAASATSLPPDGL